MANYRDLTGDYEADRPNIEEMFRELMTILRVDNWEGKEIEHQFTTTANEEIDHNMQTIPTRIIATKFEDAQATVQFISATEETVTLKSSDAALKLTFYLE